MSPLKQSYMIHMGWTTLLIAVSLSRKNKDVSLSMISVPRGVAPRKALSRYRVDLALFAYSAGLSLGRSLIKGPIIRQPKGLCMAVKAWSLETTTFACAIVKSDNTLEVVDLVTVFGRDQREWYARPTI
jgi:hypothetical protein